VEREYQLQETAFLKCGGDQEEEDFHCQKLKNTRGSAVWERDSWGEEKTAHSFVQFSKEGAPRLGAAVKTLVILNLSATRERTRPSGSLRKKEERTRWLQGETG